MRPPSSPQGAGCLKRSEVGEIQQCYREERMNLNTRNFYKEFIKEEIDFYLREANFDERERLLFLYRNKKMPLEEIAERMCCSVSTINRINRTMKKKIIKASKFYYSGISKEWE